MSGTPSTEPDLTGIDLSAVLGQQITMADIEGLNDEEKQAILDLAAEREPTPEAPAAPTPEPTPTATPDPVLSTPDPAPVQTPPPEPVRIPDVTAHVDVLKTADKSRDALLDRYDDGELTKEELRTELAKLDQQIEAAKTAVADRDRLVQEAEKPYWDEVNRFKADYPDLFSDQHMKGFNAMVMEIQKHPASISLTDRQVFEKAAKDYAAFVGIELKPAGGAAPASKGVVERQQGRPEAQPSLRNMPQSDIPTADEGTFSSILRQIENADPYDAEEMMERLSDEQRERLLRQVG